MGGAIPAAIKQQTWTNLDLSFNRFTGSLRSDFAVVADDAALNLAGNHLSGELPPNVIRVRSVLEKNRFACDMHDFASTLPAHDEEFYTYQCRNSLNQVGLLWAIPYFVLLGLVLIVGCGTLLNRVIAGIVGVYVTTGKAWMNCFMESQQSVDATATATTAGGSEQNSASFVVVLPLVAAPQKLRRTSSLFLFKTFMFD
jgi:hypothetical protein